MEVFSTHVGKLVVAEVGLVALEELHSQVAVQSVPLLQTDRPASEPSQTCPAQGSRAEPDTQPAVAGKAAEQGKHTYIELLQLVDSVLGIQ